MIFKKKKPNTKITTEDVEKYLDNLFTREITIEEFMEYTKEASESIVSKEVRELLEYRVTCDIYMLFSENDELLEDAKKN